MKRDIPSPVRLDSGVGATARLDRAISAPLRRVRRLLRAMAAFEGVSWAAIGTGTTFWLVLGTDYVAEPGIVVRAALLVIASVIVLALSARYVVWRVMARIDDAALALLIERRHPEMGDRLVTAVELARRPHPFSPALVERATQEASERLAGVEPSVLLRGGRIAVIGGLCLATVASIAAFVVWRPVLAETFWRRVALLEQRRYPHETRLTVLAFDGLEKNIARGRDYDMMVEADPRGVVPDRATLHYRMTDSGVRGRATMTKVGSNRFRFAFRNVLESIELVVRAGDDHSDRLRLRAVDPPRLDAVRIVARPPAYTGIEERQVKVEGSPIAAPLGSEMTVTMRADKPLVRLDCGVRGRNLPTRRLSDRASEVRFVLEETMSLAVTFEDTDGITPTEPFPIDLVAIPDHAPRVEATPIDIGSAVTPSARIPLHARVGDDYGVARLLVEVSGASTEATRREVAIEASDRREFEQTIALEVSSLQPTLGRRLQVAVVAVDAESLDGANEGRSESHVFDVVAADELLARIAVRELNLRQRFEQIIREIEESVRRRDEIQRLGDQREQQVRVVRRLHVDGVIRSLRKNANETAGVAEEFRGIAAEMRNNRIAVIAKIERLEHAVLRPLVEVGAHEFPDVIERFEELRGTLGSSGAEDRLAVCGESLDRLLTRCREALNGMLKLEDFNELVGTLRSLMADQEKLLISTIRERRRKVLDLLK